MLDSTDPSSGNQVDDNPSSYIKTEVLVEPRQKKQRLLSHAKECIQVCHGSIFDFAESSNTQYESSIFHDARQKKQMIPNLHL